MLKCSKHVDCSVTVTLANAHAAISLKFNYCNPILLVYGPYQNQSRETHLHQPNIDYDCIIRNDMSKDRGSVVVITEEGSYQSVRPW